MCLECRILGALVHHEPLPLQPNPFYSFDFRANSLQLKDHLMDSNANEFLSDTLSLMNSKSFTKFKVIKVDSDGSCLPYAVSRCLIGKEILYDKLRQDLHLELSTHAPFYESVFRQGMDDVTWSEHWEDILQESLPTRGARTGRWLGPGEHLIAMANVLGRPILLLDELSSMQKNDGTSCGLFLPYRLTRAEVLARHDGFVPSPVVIGWANQNHNHFVALIRVAHLPEESRVMFLGEEVMSVSTANAVEKTCFQQVANKRYAPNTTRNVLRTVEMELQVPFTGPMDFVSLTDSETSEDIKISIPSDAVRGSKFKASFFRPPGKLELAWQRLIVENPTTPRARALQTLHILFHNISEAFLGGDFTKMSKVSRVKLDNPMIRANVLAAHGAMDILLLNGFQKDGEFIEFKSVVDEKFIHIRDALKSLYDDSSTMKDFEGQVSGGMEFDLFAGNPACFVLDVAKKQFPELVGENEVWAMARMLYAFDGPETSTKTVLNSRKQNGCWTFGTAGFRLESERVKQVDALMQSLQFDFETLSKNSDLAKFDWNDVVLYNKRLMQITCAGCGSSDQEWTGPIDGIHAESHEQLCTKCAQPITAEMTGARKLLAFVGKCSIDGEIGAARCVKCKGLMMGRGDEDLQRVCEECT